MATIPGVPFTLIPSPAPTQTDPTIYPFPALSPITILDLVGPLAANRQPTQLSKRTVTEQTYINEFCTIFNELNTFFLELDGSNVWAGTAPLNMNQGVGGANSRIINLEPGSNPNDAATLSQVTGSLVSPHFTGIPTAPTAAPGTDNPQLATTAYTDAAVLVETGRAETEEAALAAAISALSVPIVNEYVTPGSYTYVVPTLSPTAVLVTISAIGGGGGGAENGGSHNGPGGGAGGAVISMPMLLQANDEVAIVLGSGGAGGSSVGGSGTATTITVTRTGVVLQQFTCNPGAGGASVTNGVGGLGGTVVAPVYTSGTPTLVAFPFGATGQVGAVGTGGTGNASTGGNSAVAAGGEGSHAGPVAAVDGTYGSGGGGGDIGSNGGNGWALIVAQGLSPVIH